MTTASKAGSEAPSEAGQCFSSGFHCSEAVLIAGAGALGRNVAEIIPSVATAFGGGMRLGGPCGALTGALMTIGLAVGRRDPEDKGKKDLAARLGPEFGAIFLKEFGHLTCHELTGHNPAVPEESTRWRASNGRQTFCLPLVERTVDLLMAFLNENGLLDSTGKE